MNAYSPLGRVKADQHAEPPSGAVAADDDREGRHAEPINGMLDLWEAQTKLLIDNGAEAQMRRRLDRMLPPIAPDPDLFAAAAPATVAAAPSSLAAKFENAVDYELHLASLSSDLARIAKLKMGGIAHQAVSRIKAFVDEALKGAIARRTAR